VEFYALAVQFQPLSAAARLDLASSLASSGRTLEALPEFEATINLEPTEVRAWTGLGYLQFQLGNMTEARRCFETALDNAPNDALLRQRVNLILRADPKTARSR
jgi:Flp pilus assembly protein TadD